MAQHDSGIATLLDVSSSYVFEARENGELIIRWGGTSTDLSLTFGAVTMVLATGAAAPNNGAAIVVPIAGGQSVTIATGGAMKALVTSRQRLT